MLFSANPPQQTVIVDRGTTGYGAASGGTGFGSGIGTMVGGALLGSLVGYGIGSFFTPHYGGSGYGGFGGGPFGGGGGGYGMGSSYVEVRLSSCPIEMIK